MNSYDINRAAWQITVEDCETLIVQPKKEVENYINYFLFVCALISENEKFESLADIKSVMRQRMLP